ncbi:MAG: LysE family transporter [Taibaiella sp.]|nr:LysE family transporter [Taibaiella sp.]
MHVHFIDAVVKGLLLGLFMAVSVGPTLFAVIKYSLNLSYKAGLTFVLGVSLSDILYVTVANLAASWLKYLESYERSIAYGGATVLMVVGLAGFIKKQKPKRPSKIPITITGGHYFKIFLSGFLVNTLNPGAFITWLGAVTLTANTPPFYRILLFGTCLTIILSIDFSKVFLADRIKRLLTLRRIIFLHKFSAACLFLIGAALFVSTAFNVQFKSPGGGNKMDNILSKQSAVR